MWSACYILAAFGASSVLAKDWDSPAYTSLYQYPLQIPPIKKPLK